MSSTFSTNLAIELIGTGDQAGTWGNTTNSNLGTLIEQSISGYVTQAVSTGTDTTITIPNGSTGVARNMYIELTGTGGASTNLIVPANKKLYFIFNNSTGAVTVKVSGQTGVSVPTGKKMVLVSNGTDIVNGLNFIADFGTNSFTVTNLTASSATITNLIATSGSITNLVSSDASATVLRAGSATLTHLSATSASITNLTLTSLVISNLSIASANITTLTSASATITNLLATSLAVSSIATFSAGSAAAPSITTTGDTNTGIFFPAADTIGFSEGGVEAMRINSSGSMGLGTTSDLLAQQGNLALNGASGTGNGAVLGIAQSGSIIGGIGQYSRMTGSGTSQDIFIQSQGSSNNVGINANPASAYIYFQTQGTERMRLDSSGNLIVGGTSPVISGAGRGNITINGSSTAIMALSVGGSAKGWVYHDNTNLEINAGTTGAMIMYTAGTERMRLDSSGNLGLGVTPSASNACTNIELPFGATLSARSNTTAPQFAMMSNAVGNWYEATYKINGFATRYTQQGNDGTHAWFNAASGTAGNAITFTQAMTLDASGNLLVGTTTAIASASNRGNITIGGSASSILSLGTSSINTGYLYFDGGGTAGLELWNVANSFLRFGTNNTERARLTSGGDLLVGTTNTAGDARFTVQQSSGNRICRINSVDTGTVEAFQFVKTNGGAAQVGSISMTTTATAYNTSSDVRLKDNIAPADNAGSVIDAIEVVKHDWKVGGHTRYGMIAQDLHMVAPEAVSVGDADDVEDFKNPWGVDYSKLVPMMMKELQSLRKRVAELEAK